MYICIGFTSLFLTFLKSALFLSLHLHAFLTEAELINVELTVSECRINQMQTVATGKVLVCQKHERGEACGRLNESKERMRKSSVAGGKRMM